MSEKQTYELPPQAAEEAPAQTHTTNAAKAPIDPEKERENVRQANPNGFVRTTSGVGKSLHMQRHCPITRYRSLY